MACIGAGPASLACAAELRKRGYRVTIFESRALPGGLNTYGVAEYKLRPSDSLSEVELVEIAGRGISLRSYRGGRNRDRGTGARRTPRFSRGRSGPARASAHARRRANGVVDALRFIADYKTERKHFRRDAALR